MTSKRQTNYKSLSALSEHSILLTLAFKSVWNYEIIKNVSNIVRN